MKTPDHSPDTHPHILSLCLQQGVDQTGMGAPHTDNQTFSRPYPESEIVINRIRPMSRLIKKKWTSGFFEQCFPDYGTGETNGFAEHDRPLYPVQLLLGETIQGSHGLARHL